MARHVIVSGHVQGVGFRFATQQTAREHNLVGWVRNKVDGTVEMEIAGNEASMDNFLNDVKSGLNKSIHVKDMLVDTTNKSADDFNSFTIR